MRADDKLGPFAESIRRQRIRCDNDLAEMSSEFRERLLVEGIQALEMAALDKGTRQRINERWQLIQNLIDDASCTAMAIRYACQDGDPKINVRIAELADRSVAEHILAPLSDEWKRTLRGLLDEVFEAAVSEIVFVRNGIQPHARNAAQTRRSMLKAFEAIVDTARPDQSESAGNDDAFTEGLELKSAQVGADDNE